MESNLNEVVILDLFGLPGSGKTTISKSMSLNKKQYGYKIQDNIYKINNNYGAFRRMFIKLLNTFSYTIKNLFFLIDLFSLVGKDSFTSNKELIKQWINICFVLSNINKSRGKDIIIADQGIVQAAISLSYNNEDININTIIKKINEKVLFRIKHIYISIEIETCLKRLEQRKNGKSRLDNETRINIRKYHLESIKGLCEKINREFNCIVIDNNKDQKYTINNEVNFK